MESIRYVDIFATKGIEYLLIIGFLAVFVFVCVSLLRQGSPRSASPARTRVRHLGPTGWFDVQDVHYHPGHTWARIDNKEIVTVGIDDFAHKLLGEAEAIDLPEVGSRLEQGGTGWRVQVKSRTIDMVAPVGGEIVEINSDVVDDPGAATEDPYGNGWLMRVRVPNVRAAARNLLSGDYAKAWMDETVRALRSRMTGELGVVMQDGGTPVSGFAVELSGDGWHALAEEFLLTK